MKPLRPSHREKKRYLLIEGKDANKKNIEEALFEFIGILGCVEASPRIIKTPKDQKNKSKRVILSINRKALDKVRVSFLLSGKDLKIKKVSGILRKL